MSQKRPETDDAVVEISLKRLRISLIDDDGDYDEDEDESMEESTNVVEIMKSLEVELNYPRNNHQMMKSRSWSSSSSLSIINGCDGESCGPSFSDSSSTVMASLDMSTCFSYLVGPTPTPTVDLEDSSSSSSSSSSSPPPRFGFTGVEEGNDEINGCDEEEEVEEEDEDEWLDRVLNETPIEEEFLWKEERSDLSF